MDYRLDWQQQDHFNLTETYAIEPFLQEEFYILEEHQPHSSQLKFQKLEQMVLRLERIRALQPN